MKSRLPKVLHPLCGRPMLGYVIDAAREATGERPVVVYSPSTAAIRDVFDGEAEFVLQDPPQGTGDAVRVAMAALPADAAEVLVVSGDVPRVSADVLRELLDQRRLDEAAFALTSVIAFDPRQLGRVVRGDAGAVEKIVEVKDATEEELEIGEINAGLYAFDGEWLRSRIGRLTPSQRTKELYLTELVTIARADGRIVAALEVEDDGRLLGINDRAELAQAEWDLRTEINDRHMRNGVTMRDPSTVYLDSTVELAEDVTLEPNVILRGRTRVGRGSVIGAGSQLVDATIGEGCTVLASIIDSSELRDGVQVGPWSRVRNGAVLDDEVRIGNFAEIKNSRLGRGVKQNHFSYLGDADVGEGTNVGAGSITANWDGVTKHPTKIGKRVFLGVDTMLRAPVTVGDGAKTGAGAVVTKDVPPGKLAVGVPARIRELKATETDGAAGPDRAADGAATESAAEGAATTNPTDAGRRRAKR
jgi:bifunctional UDP-N-acetylglucosamine pyrophosphorylase/glucosamine-1-phosphate N-acetyltransferase